jgi:predicted dienelactone hydrolase
MVRFGGLIGVWFLLVIGVQAQQRPDAPRYARVGDFAVGVREFTLEAATRPLQVRVWYPAEADAGKEPTLDYPFVLTFTVSGQAYRDAPVSMTNAPFPLVVFSHGSGGTHVLHLWLIEHLASRGFIVMTADHPRNDVAATVGDGFNFLGARQDFAQSYALRPQDVLRQIALADELNGAGDFAAKINTDAIAVIGHSFGGWTALAVGGARMDFASLRAWCDKPDALLDNVCFILPLERDIAAARGYETPPTDVWAATSDPRIKAIVGLAPWNAPVLNFDEITAPTLILVGTNDQTTIPERDAYVIADKIPAPTTLVTFAHAGHFAFIDACPPVMLNFGLFETCSDAVWDTARVHDISNHLITAFLLQHLRGDTTAGEALSEQRVNFAGVTYTQK